MKIQFRFVKFILICFILISFISIVDASIQPDKHTLSKRDQEFTNYHRELGVKAEEGGNFIEAERQYLDALKYNNSDTDTLFDLGHLYLKINKPDKARVYLDILLDINPNDCAALNLLGIAYSGLKKHDASIQCWKKSLEILPEQPKVIEMIDEINKTNK